ncbi:hypothetical protein PI86_05850 [Burkholderia sp. A9]|nr:hypothetical protein PI86_05850 [Burkholderia sp. A9]
MPQPVAQIFAHAEHHLKLDASPIDPASQNMCDNVIDHLFIVGRNRDKQIRFEATLNVTQKM